MSELYIDQIFKPAKEYLHSKQDDREELIRIGRDITSYSKKAIFSLHRTFSEKQSGPIDTSELVKYLEVLSDRLVLLNSIYQRNIQLRGNISGPIEELVEFFTFGYFIQNQELLPYKLFIIYIRILLDARGNSNKEPYEVILKSLFFKNWVPKEYLSSTEVNFIDIGDFLMGIFDCTGEIMRLCIQQSSGSQGTLEVVTTEECYRYLQELYQQFQLLIQKYPGISIYRGIFDNEIRSKGNMSFMKKLDVFNSSIRKIENTLLDILISDRETI